MFSKCGWLLLVTMVVMVGALMRTALADSDIFRDRTEPDTERFRYPSPNAKLCMDVRPQNSLNVEQILGQWYGNEIIMHTVDTPGVFNYDSCVLVNIDDFTEQMHSINLRRSQFAQQQQQSSYYYGGSSKPDTLLPFSSTAGHSRQHHSGADDDDYAQYTKYLRLVWSERDDNLEYTLNYTDYNPGFWMSVGEQRGSLVTLKQYTQFTGSVQVVKAVNDHLVLTFCGTNPQSTIYSIVLSRKDGGLSDEKILSVRKMLWRRGLAVDSIRKVCVKSAALAVTSTVLCVWLAVFGVLAKAFIGSA